MMIDTRMIFQGHNDMRMRALNGSSSSINNNNNNKDGQLIHLTLIIRASALVAIQSLVDCGSLAGRCKDRSSPIDGIMMLHR